MATGRTDPQRRERILAATLDHIAEEGVAGVSHRRIAVRADVPLGSMTYHFAGIDDLLREAFTRFADEIVAVFERHLADVGTPSGPAKPSPTSSTRCPRVHVAISSSPTSSTPSPPAATSTANSPTPGWPAAATSWSGTSTRTPPANWTR